MEERPVSWFFVRPWIGAVTLMRALHFHGPPSREANRYAEQIVVLFGLCCPNRRTNRCAFVCLLPKRQFCSAVCSFASSSDGGAAPPPSLDEAAPTERGSVWASVTEQTPNKRDSVPLLFGCSVLDLEFVPETGGTAMAHELADHT